MVVTLMPELLEMKMMPVVARRMRAAGRTAMPAARGCVARGRERGGGQRNGGNGCDEDEARGGHGCAGIATQGTGIRMQGPARADTTGRALHRDLLTCTGTGRSRR